MPCGWSRCAGRLDTLRHGVGRQKPTPSGRRCWFRRQEPPRHTEGAGQQELLWALGGRSSKVTGAVAAGCRVLARLRRAAGPVRCAAGHCCGGAGAAARSGRSRCLRQEMAEQDPLCLAAGDTASGRSRFLGGSWCCAGRQEQLRSRCGGCQKKFHRVAGATPGGRAAGYPALGDSGGPPWGRSQGVAHEEASCWCSSLWCVFGVPRRTRCGLFLVQAGGVGRGTHTSEAVAVAVDKEELRTCERGACLCAGKKENRVAFC